MSQDITSVVISRDGRRCKVCGVGEGELYTMKEHQMPSQMARIVVHYIHDRGVMPAGGTVQSNLITLCESCHCCAEDVRFGMLDYLTDDEVAACRQSNLYKLIGSSYSKAVEDSEKI